MIAESGPTHTKFVNPNTGRKIFATILAVTDINTPKKIIKYLAYKGSVSVNGVSLTISGAGKDWFKVSLISHTLKNTNFRKLKKGDKVNIEVDVIARYLEKLLKNNK